MSDLVARLRQVKSARQQGFHTIHEPDALANEAADVIEAREAQIAALQAKLAEARNDARKCSKEMSLLRQAIVRYGDRSRMATVEPMELQQAIDRAMKGE